MTTLPVTLPPVRHANTYARPVVEEASPFSCVARARYTPREVTYDTLVRLEGGQWSVVTKTNGRPLFDEHYPMARGHEIGLAVINWWRTVYHPEELTPLNVDEANGRAVWLSRAAHKLLTEVGDHANQLAALQILASPYGMNVAMTNTAPNLEAANWATAAHRNLEGAVPEAQRPRAVWLLVELVTGLGDVKPAAAKVAA